ncbi:MAG: membrane dipeptidase [Prevotella sp.]|nr:membrane dipeptidase [Prevotella sp.]
MVDLHNDALLALPPEQLLPYLRQAKCAGVDEIWLSVWTTELGHPLTVIAEKKALLDTLANDPQYPICRLHVEDAWFLSTDNIDDLLVLHPHSVGLTWNDANPLAGGAHSRNGITPLGYQMIQRLEAAGVQIDTAHLNRRSFWQFAHVTTRPLICTHTAMHAVHRHARNLNNRQIRAIINSGGYIGIALVPKFLTKTTTSCGIYDLVKHISYFKRHFDGTALRWGTDFYGTEQLPDGINDYRDIRYLLQAQIIGYSVLRQPMLAYQIGRTTAPRRLLITAGMHAREWIGTLALQTWLKQPPTPPDDLCIMMVPCCNPDGVRLATTGCTHLPRRRQKFLIHVNHRSQDFSLWKANLHAVDLNVNFDAGWGQGRTNLTTTAPANYIGPEPHSEPENRALLRLIKNFHPTASIALHSKGKVIYYSRTEDQATAECLAKLTQFQAVLSTGSYGGLTDYLALRHGIPSFTVELGDDALAHPLGSEHLPAIMPSVNQIINYFFTGE